VKKSEARRTFGDRGDEVKFWLAKDDGVEASRPSHCPACGVPAYRGDGGLHLHGHGVRERTVWGPPTPDGPAWLATVLMRRYRCTVCTAVRTVQRPGLTARFRYSLAAIALALTAWAVWRQPPAAVRARICPWPIVGASEAERWPSLRRWTRRAAALFELPALPLGTLRAQAARIAQLVRARGPTERGEAERVFVGARAR